MLDLTPYLQIADKLGVLVLGVVFIVALYRKWLVFGWLYKECDDARTLYRKDFESRLTKAEADLERVRAERAGGRGD